MIFKGFSLEFSSYHSHKHANLDKLILLFSRATFNTVIKAAMYRNSSIQICKTQGKQIVLWEAELAKPSFLWIYILCLLLCPITAVTVLITVLLSPVTSLITACQILQPDYYTTPHITCLLAGVEAACAVMAAELGLVAAAKGGKISIQELYWLWSWEFNICSFCLSVAISRKAVGLHYEVCVSLFSESLFTKMSCGTGKLNV